MIFHNKTTLYKISFSLDLLNRCNGGGDKLRLFGLATLKHSTQTYFIAFCSPFINVIPIWFVYFVSREAKC